MALFNSVKLIGRLVRAPYITTVGTDTKKALFTVAVDRMGKDAGADFVNVTALGKSAEIVEKALVGTTLVIEGRISTSTYEKDGKTMSSQEVLVEQVRFYGKKPEGKAEEVDVPVKEDPPSEEAPSEEEGVHFPWE